jgi:ketosteroid isomerase-like protein
MMGNNRAKETTMKAVTSKWKYLPLALLLFVSLTACDALFGSSGPEASYQAALSSVDEKWEIYEVIVQDGSTVIRVEVDDTVPFDKAKLAAAAIQAAEPQFNGYVEFFNSEVGMVLRKLEIFPAT